MSRQVGHYELRGRLGSGGGGVVHEAVDSRLGRRVVLKRLHRGADREAALAEARSLSAVEHPNVCPLFDVIEDGAETWLVMPRVEGESLRQLVAHGPLPIPLVLSIGAQVADGLEAAHRLGIVHRDLKPANVMVSPDGRVRILDFGLARATRGEPGKGDSDPARTAPRGTIPYMAPEQFEAGRVTPASDIFALGILLYEAASGFHPFRQPVAAAEPGMLQRSIRFHEPEPLGRRRLEAPDALATLVDRCLAKVPEARPPSAAHVAEALRAIGRERGDVVRTPPPAPPSARPGWLDRVLGRGQAVAVGERRQPPSPPGAPRRALGTAVREAFLEARALLAVVPDGEDVRLRLYRAEDRLADVLREEPSFAPAYAAMGRAHLEAVRLGVGGPAELAAAEACLADALDLDPLLVEADLARALVRLARRDKDAARSDIQRLRLQHPGQPSVRLATASMLRLDGLHGEALAELADALDLDPRGAPTVHEARARVLQYQGRLEEAGDEIERGLGLEPTHPLLRTALGHLLLLRGEPDEAARVLEDVVARCRGVRLAHPTLALARLRQGRRDEASGLLTDEVRAAAEADGDTAYRIATFFAADGEERPAVLWLERAVALGNENWPWLCANPGWSRLAKGEPMRRVLAAVARRHRAARRSWTAFYRRLALATGDAA